MQESVEISLESLKTEEISPRGGWVETMKEEEKSPGRDWFQTMEFLGK